MFSKFSDHIPAVKTRSTKNGANDSIETGTITSSSFGIVERRFVNDTQIFCAYGCTLYPRNVDSFYKREYQVDAT